MLHHISRGVFETARSARRGIGFDVAAEDRAQEVNADDSSRLKVMLNFE